MLKTMFSLALILLLANCSKKEGSNKEKTVEASRTAASMDLPIEGEPSPAYCAAIRGNGELVPSQWSALSRIVENLGMPEAMSGGSSATITMFYMESIAANPIVANETNPVLKKRKQALLLKTIPVYKKLIAEHEDVANAYKKFIELKDLSSTVDSSFKATLLAAKNHKAIEEAVRKYGYVFNPEFLRNLRTNFSFAQKEIKNAFVVFGAFDAVGDENIFFRPGLVDFKYLALLIGQIGDFYAGNVDASIMKDMNSFLTECAIPAHGNLWPNGEGDISCLAHFSQLARRNIQNVYTSENITNFNENAQIFKKVGSSITSFPATSVLVGDSFKKYTRESKAYKKGSEKNYGDFYVNNDEIKFGYWGESDGQLTKLKSKLQKRFPNDVKTSKFMSLGSANWFEVLSSSPAEPGLANFQRIVTNTDSKKIKIELGKGHMERWNSLTYKDSMISAGGWSDLQPTLILREHGCENIVYVTRTDGPSLFGQRVFIRLANLTKRIPFWNKLGDHNKEGWDLTGDNATAKDTDWYRMYSMNNNNSSHNISVKEADANYCTNWNAFQVFKPGDLDKLWYDAYNSPVVLKEGADPALKVTDAEIKPPLPGCI